MGEGGGAVVGGEEGGGGPRGGGRGLPDRRDARFAIWQAGSVTQLLHQADEFKVVRERGPSPLA